MAASRYPPRARRDAGGTAGSRAVRAASGRSPWRSRRWAIVAALSVTETVSWGVLYYTFAVFLVPMELALGFSKAELTGAFSVALLVSGVAGMAIGRYLDRRGPRGLMTTGSIAGVALVIAWSQVESLTALYAIWAALGLVMAAVLYEPAFTVLAKHFDEAGERRQAMTALTLVGAMASFIFLPLSQQLIDAYGWRDALLVLAAVLAAVTVPLHAIVLRGAPEPRELADGNARPPLTAGRALRAPAFWMLTGAFMLATITKIAMIVHTIPFLLERGHGPAFAAFALGLVGIAQIPGRLVFALMAARLPSRYATAAVFGLIAAGIAIVVSVPVTAATLVGLSLLGMGDGMTTLARATIIADRFGASSYGTIAGVAAACTTGARTAGPVAAAVWAATAGYTAVLWTLVALAVAAAALTLRTDAQRAGAVT